MASLAPNSPAQNGPLQRLHAVGFCEPLASLPSSSPPALARGPSTQRSSRSSEDWKQAFRNKVILGQHGRAISIGRSSSSMLQIESKTATISRKHADIVALCNGQFELHVYGMNGVRVNGKLYLKDSRVTLADNDQVNFVGIRFTFRTPAAVQAADRPCSPQLQAFAIDSSGDGDDWWPEPVRKRSRTHHTSKDSSASELKNSPASLVSNTTPRSGAEQKLLSVCLPHLPSEDGGLYENSTDTLVGGSEVGVDCIMDGVTGPDKHTTLKQMMMMDGLPPSSPPPLNALADMLYSEQSMDDALLDSVDILDTTPERSKASTPAPTVESTPGTRPDAESMQSASPAVRPKLLAQKKERHGTPLSKASGSAPGTADRQENGDKENSSIQQQPGKQPHKPSLSLANKYRKSAKAAAAAAHDADSPNQQQHIDLQNHQAKHKQDSAKPGRRHKAPSKAKKAEDSEMMDSLRELLGIVDPSECLADSIDSETEEFLTNEPAEPISLSTGTSLVDLIVSTMVFSARTSHTISDLLRDLSRAEGEAESRVWRHHVTWTLFHNKCFGRVERRVKDASDRRVEDKWYYDASKDDCIERRQNFGGLVRTARRCTLRDTQYFFKQVPKLPSFRYK